ncbi:MAG: hypothetical protein KC731_40050, partial [Myxococcales bacterium]|nr:hypothetical protein [Myxococcales bacterium]
AAAAAAEALSEVVAIVCISTHGITPTLLSDYRPRVPVLALTKEAAHCRRLAAYWGVHPVRFDFDDVESTEETIGRAEAKLMADGLVKRGEKIIITMAVPAMSGLHTNTLKIHRVGTHQSTVDDLGAGIVMS